MNEFNNRIDAQREVLNLVNRRPWKEELYGLSSGAISRWVHVNGIDPSSDLLLCIQKAAGKLFFLANKSQEQITAEYLLLSAEVSELIARLTRIVNTA